MTDQSVMTIYDKDGNLISKEDFLKNAEQIYSSVVEEVEEDEDYLTKQAILKIALTPEKQIDPKTVYTTYNFLTKAFYITSEITHETALDFFNFVRFWNETATQEDDDETLTVYIDSVGGDLEASFEIISIMKASSIPVNTCVIGRAWSGAFLICLAGKERTAIPYSSFLYHEGSAGFEADAHKYIQFSEYYKNILLKNIKKIVLNTTNITAEIYEEHHKDDWWIDTNEALKLNIIDKIVEKEVFNI